jgi:hypothetical protein
VPAYEIKHCTQKTGRPRKVSLAPEPSRSVRFVAAESHLGWSSAEVSCGFCGRQRHSRLRRRGFAVLRGDGAEGERACFHTIQHCGRRHGLLLQLREFAGCNAVGLAPYWSTTTPQQAPAASLKGYLTEQAWNDSQFGNQHSRRQRRREQRSDLQRRIFQQQHLPGYSLRLSEALVASGNRCARGSGARSA